MNGEFGSDYELEESKRWKEKKDKTLVGSLVPSSGRMKIVELEELAYNTEKAHSIRSKLSVLVKLYKYNGSERKKAQYIKEFQKLLKWSEADIEGVVEIIIQEGNSAYERLFRKRMPILQIQEQILRAVLLKDPSKRNIRNTLQDLASILRWGIISEDAIKTLLELGEWIKRTDISLSLAQLKESFDEEDALLPPGPETIIKRLKSIEGLQTEIREKVQSTTEE
jgi:hypothetical protein